MSLRHSFYMNTLDSNTFLLREDGSHDRGENMEKSDRFVEHNHRKKSLGNDECGKFISNIPLSNENGFVLSEEGIQ
jgi:hypothetical protein